MEPIRWCFRARSQAFYNAPIYARVPGYLRIWYKDIGAQVHKGEVLAVIDTPELDQQIEQAKADLQNAVAARDLSQTTAQALEQPSHARRRLQAGGRRKDERSSGQKRSRRGGQSQSGPAERSQGLRQNHRSVRRDGDQSLRRRGRAHQCRRRVDTVRLCSPSPTSTDSRLCQRAAKLFRRNQARRHRTALPARISGSHLLGNTGRQCQRYQRKIERVACGVSCRQSAGSVEARRLRASHYPCSDAAKRRHGSRERAHLRRKRIAGRNSRSQRPNSNEAHQDRARSRYGSGDRFRHRPPRPHRRQSARTRLRKGITCTPNRRRPRNDRAPGGAHSRRCLGADRHLRMRSGAGL